MKRPVILAYDDLHNYEDGKLVEARNTQIIGIDGEWYELDFTDEHHAPIRALMIRLAAAGQRLEEPPAKVIKGKLPADHSVSAFRRGYREWMISRGLQAELKTPGGSYRYPEKRVAEYREYLKSVPLYAVA